VIQNYKELDVWKKSIAFTIDVYRLTGGFPETEQNGLIYQIRRAAISVPANIAEGWGRGSKKEYIQFLKTARGSLMQLETHLTVGCMLTFLTQDELEVASKTIEEIGKMLNGLIRELKSRTEAA
jgi:four helix bundle protein